MELYSYSKQLPTIGLTIKVVCAFTITVIVLNVASVLLREEVKADDVQPVFSQAQVIDL